MFHITRYSIKNPDLHSWVKFIWHFETETEVTVNHKLLPSDSIDIILNRSDLIRYQIGQDKFAPDNFHFNGIRDQYGLVLQKGKLKVFGISFHAFGLYPVLRKPLSGCTNQVVDLKSVSENLNQEFELVLQEYTNVEEIVRMLEKALARSFLIEEPDMKAASILESFSRNCPNISIGEFCSWQDLNRRTFERLCLKYIGYSPKTLQRIARFRNASNQLMSSSSAEKLTWIAYDNDYYDQAHFIKEFREFSGVSPGRFAKANNTVKGNTEYTHK